MDNEKSINETDLILKRISKLPNEIIHKIIEEYEYMYYIKDMEVCYRCGNIWDGNAQCLCFYYFSSDEENDNSVNEE